MNIHLFLWSASMPKVSQTYLEERRQQILDAAIACFARKGFHQTTMEDIGQEAGLSPGVAYRYFANKDDIIIATVQESLGRWEHSLDAMAHADDILHALDEWTRVYFARFEQPEFEARTKVRVQVWAEAVRDPEVGGRLRQLRDIGLGEWEAIVRKAQEQGQIDPGLEARAVANVLVASLDGFRLHWLADPQMDVWQYRQVLMAMFRGLHTQNSTTAKL
jgi:AcrR family transcriptional regulator